MSLIISSINWNYKPYDLSGLFAQYTIPDCATIVWFKKPFKIILYGLKNRSKLFWGISDLGNTIHGVGNE